MTHAVRAGIFKLIHYVCSSGKSPLLLFWILFTLFALGMLVLDLMVFHRPEQVVSPRAALGWSALWVLLAAVFAAILFFWQGRQATLEFVTGYVLELSLSADNLFVFLIIFRFFAVPEGLQHGVLFWGVVGALVLRGIFIITGVGLIHHFHWVLYIFGALLIISGINLLRGKHQIDPKKNPVVKLLRRWVPMTDGYQGEKFFVRGWRGNPGLYATPLLMVLAIIETTDVLFAVDSIPAVLAVTLNAFIVYTSNVFAILGLRSMYFAVAELIKIFRFLHYGLALLLILVGLKMIAASRFPVPTFTTLSVVAAVLVISIVMSILFPEKNAKNA
jgi:tellurite resistance protein TerC